jgi:hypothetical protein
MQEPLYVQANRLRNASDVDHETMVKFFKKRDTFIMQAKVSDYLELSPLNWPKKWSNYHGETRSRRTKAGKAK